MKTDSHIHGIFSSDSRIDYDELCQKAILKGYDKIAFTEHYDLLTNEMINYGLLSLKAYFKVMNVLKEKYPELTIAIGIELGEPHRVADISKKMFSQYKPEFIIGSLHVSRLNEYLSLNIDNSLTSSQIKRYYEENLEMVETGNFHALGHLGIFKRGLQYWDINCEKHAKSIIEQILRTIIKKNIALEVNNASFRSSINNILPEPQYLKLYKELGGELICIGSDSHRIEVFDTFYDKTLDILTQSGFCCSHFMINDKWVINELKRAER
jgi:histidinol-phosphatase (PHP family)